MVGFRTGVALALVALVWAAPAARAEDGAFPSGAPATAQGVPGQVVPASGFSSLSQAWDILVAARAGAEAADAAATGARAVSDAAAAALSTAQSQLAARETALTVAQQVAAERAQDVGDVARQMYISAGAVPGSAIAILSLPAGVDLAGALDTQQYLVSASDFVVAAAREARLAEAQAAAQLATAQLEVDRRSQESAEAARSADAADTVAVAAASNADQVRAALEEFVSSLAVPTPSATQDCADPSQDAIAAAIYAQAKGLGLGDVAAVVGIGVGLGESALSNDTEGDCWGGDCGNGRTSSRGVFQQFWSWPPPGTAWSGQSGPTGGVGTPYDQFNGRNAWGPDGWAVTDPRMDPAQAANMFFLGPDYSATAGLEDNTLFQSLRNADPLDLSGSQMVTMAHQVQGFPPQHMGSYEVNMSGAMAYFLRIKAGLVPLPAFQAPLAGMYKSATTSVTLDALRDVAASPDDGGAGKPLAIPANGMLLVGDSLMEGVATLGGAPKTLQGGAVTALHEVGIGTRAALDRWATQVAAGPSRVVISLGSNDSPEDLDGYTQQVDRLMAAAGPDRHVYWFMLHYRPVAALNIVLMRAAERYPNLTLVDVREALGPGSGYTSAADNYLHPGTGGYQVMWRAAVSADRALSGYCPAW